MAKFSAVNIIGKSEPIKRIMKQINQVAETDANVLILGDTGVGKELVATAQYTVTAFGRTSLLYASSAAHFPKNCCPASYSVMRRVLLQEQTDESWEDSNWQTGGTIFLDEMGDLSLDMQVQLLRALETKRFERVGGTQTIKSDFRLVAATNRDLKEEVTAR